MAKKKKRKVVKKKKNIKKKKSTTKKKSTNKKKTTQNKKSNVKKVSSKSQSTKKKIENIEDKKTSKKYDSKKSYYKYILIIIIVILLVLYLLFNSLSPKQNNKVSNIVLKDNYINYISKVITLKINNERKVYLAIKGKYTIVANYEYVGDINDTLKYYSENDKIATVSDKGIITGIKNGITKIHATIGDKDEYIDVHVTNLITNRPTKGFDYKKKNLGCNKYSRSDNDLIDEILKSRIESVGYKTRAGVVEAARFLTLDFPYRINYFYENGRQTTNNVDGEGRYYHVGFYLHSSRYKNITGSRTGPKTWGCSLYSKPAHRKMDNGLDCSGFVSWALLNGGFNVKDVGAGWSNKRDLTDYGDVKKITTSLSTSNKIKVGDLLHSERAGGHIGIIVGIDKNNYYVAQALWYGEKEL